MTIDTVAGWHAYMAAPSDAALDVLIADDCVFHSPAVHTPQFGKAVTIRYLGAATRVLGGGNFRYRGEWRAGRSAVLEFERTMPDDLYLNGIDMIAWDADGRITSFKVMVRPMKALAGLIPLMAAALADADQH